MQRICYIVDIRKCQKKAYKLAFKEGSESFILSLTPYSNYLLDNESKKYITFHALVSIEKFNQKVFANYEEWKSFFKDYEDYSFLFREIAIIENYALYLDVLIEFIERKKKENYKIVYVTDTHKEKDISLFNVSNNTISGLHYCSFLDEIVNVRMKDTFFYKIKKLKKLFFSIYYRKNILFEIKNKFFSSKTNLYPYEHKYFILFWKKQVDISINHHLREDVFLKIDNSIELVLKKLKHKIDFLVIYKKSFHNLEDTLRTINSAPNLHFYPFVYLSAKDDMIRNLLYKKNNENRIFWQHGSYFHEHIFLKYNEIDVADINFVINEYTRNLFTQVSQNKIYNVGSINFNLPFKEKKKEYDYVYIVNNMHYSWCGTYTDAKSGQYSMDGFNLYTKHKDIIVLFGEQFKAKKICIKMQPGIIDNLLYVPLLEISKKYRNVHIEFFKPLSLLFGSSRYIISDYFSSEFLNRELHYKRDIILFEGSPTPLPKDTLADMKKMFILVNTVSDLRDTVDNIENISKNRKRYDDIIEYYSSKRCDTKKEVENILKKELDARR